MKVKLKDGREVNIRPVTPDDKGGLFALFSSMSEEALRWSMAPYTLDRIQRWIESLPNLIFIAAMHGSRIVGQATVNKFTHPRRRGVAEFGIYLHQDYHNVGLGTAMTKILLRQAGEQGIHKVNLETVADNEPARHLFRKLGFAEEGRIKDSYLGEDGKFHDIILMGKIVEETPL
jgi:RimJ/RimL family protein N-acetyltransferase